MVEMNTDEIKQFYTGLQLVNRQIVILEQHIKELTNEIHNWAISQETIQSQNQKLELVSKSLGLVMEALKDKAMYVDATRLAQLENELLNKGDQANG